MGQLDKFLDNIGTMDKNYSFFGYLTTEGASGMLLNERQGTFLLRMSHQHHNLVITVLDIDNEIMNYRLDPSDVTDIYGWKFSGDIQLLENIIKNLSILKRNCPKEKRLSRCRIIFVLGYIVQMRL